MPSSCPSGSNHRQRCRRYSSLASCTGQARRPAELSPPCPRQRRYWLHPPPAKSPRQQLLLVFETSKAPCAAVRPTTCSQAILERVDRFRDAESANIQPHMRFSSARCVAATSNVI